jgi:hypothetical protein
MRAVTGALVVVAGAILWGAGAIALTMSYGISGYHADPGGWATFIGLVLVLTGLGIAVRDLLSGPPPTPPAPPNPPQ